MWMSENMLRTMDGNSKEEVAASSLKFGGRENADPTEVAAPCSAGHLIFHVGDDDNLCWRHFPQPFVQLCQYDYA